MKRWQARWNNFSPCQDFATASRGRREHAKMTQAFDIVLLRTWLGWSIPWLRPSQNVPLVMVVFCSLDESTHHMLLSHRFYMVELVKFNFTIVLWFLSLYIHLWYLLFHICLSPVFPQVLDNDFMLKIERKFLLEVPSDLSGLLEAVPDPEARLKLLGTTLMVIEVVLHIYK